VSRADGRIVYVCGSSGSGKSAYVKAQLRHHPRVLIWDVDAEYAPLPGVVGVSSPADLVGRVRRLSGPGRLAYVPDRLDRFDWFCRLAFAWGQFAACAVIAEETADVTSPGKAPAGWGTLIRRGRKYGIVTYAVTQRPSESDKTALGNAAVVRVGRLARAPDRAYMARELDIPQSRLDALRPLDWIERTAAGEVTAGRLSFPPGSAAPSKPPRARPLPGSRRTDPDRRPPPAPAAPAPAAGWTLDDI